MLISNYTKRKKKKKGNLTVNETINRSDAYNMIWIKWLCMDTFYIKKNLYNLVDKLCLVLSDKIKFEGYYR